MEDLVVLEPERAGDFAEFYREAYPDAVRLAVLLVGIADAEDVVQAAFTAVFEAAEGIDQPHAFEQGGGFNA